MKPSEFSHLTSDNTPHQVDVSTKAATQRRARAEAHVQLTTNIVERMTDSELHLPKGPVFQTAMLAGIMGAKRTADLIPLCHTIPIESINVNIELKGTVAVITSEVKTTGKTGVEMEALTAASVAALTIYDMCKALSHDITIGPIQLIEKTGGKNDFHRHAQETR
ncbi:MAG: cyclic pyranopterin monophosphate synthase MoaC [Flavobacteriales bacterium]